MFPLPLLSKRKEYDTEQDSTDGRVGASYPEDPGSRPASAMPQRAFRLRYKK